MTITVTQETITAQAETIPAPPHKSVPRRIWSGVGTFMTVIAVVVGTLALVLAIASRFSGSGGYGFFGHPVMSVLSGSMSPTIKTGDLVIDDPLSGAQASHLHVGQIISFRAGDGAIFTHRIHTIVHENGAVAYQTKGDANNAPDAIFVSPSQIIGLYSGKVPDGGYILNALHKPTTLILLIASPLLWLLSSWLYGLAREADKRDQGPALAGKKEVLAI